MIAIFLLILSLSFSGNSQKAGAATISETLTVKDFRGESVFPFRTGEDLAAVLFFISGDCPVSNRYSPEISRIVSTYHNRRVRFYLVYTDEALDKKSIESHLAEYSMQSSPALHDPKQLLVKALGATVTPEVAVVTRKGLLAYRGRIDNRFEALGRERRQITSHDLVDAIDSVIAGKMPAVPRTNAVGCYINPAGQ